MKKTTKILNFLHSSLNTVKANFRMWNNWDWSKCGEEWTVSKEWKDALISEVMYANIAKGSTILEIGPGGGRWTEFLQKVAGHLILVDLSPKCIETCKERFKAVDNIEYFVNDGKSLGFIENESIDFVWSFDAFVHIAPRDTSKYISEFYRVLKKGGKGIVHHAKDKGKHGGWRSKMTDKLFAKMLHSNNLSLIKQFDSWGEGKFHVKDHGDVISLFEKQ